MPLPRFICLGLTLCAGLCAVPAWALDFRSVAHAAPLYDAPSSKAKPLFVISAGSPVELVVSIEGWAKVRDIKGDLLWIEKKQLSDKRTVLVRSSRAQIVAKAEEKASTVYEADPDVVLELLETLPDGWLKVMHRDGQFGYVRAVQVWGW